MAGVPCPYCNETNALPAGGAAGAVLDCVACERSFVPPPAADGAADPDRTPSDTGSPPPWRRGGPTEVPGLVSAAAAAVATGAFYLAVVEPLRDSAFGSLFAERGWVPYVVTFLAAWSGVILVWKARALATQARALDFDLLPAQIAERIDPERAPAFASYLRNLPGGRSDHLLIDRVQRTLRHYRARPSVTEVVEQLRLQAEADADAVESSYTLLRVFIWAIPILGFIGTVIGIGAAVGGFSQAVGEASDLAVLKQSIGSVTAGLGVAFDTTLLALVMSVLIMFPTSALQRAEERFLAAVEAYCNENLVRRLEDADPGSPAGSATALAGRQIAATERLVQAVESLEARLDRLGPGRREPGP